MKISHLLILIGVAGAVCLMMGRSVAEPKYNTAGDVPMQRLVRLTTELTARGDTNTLAQVAGLMASTDVLKSTADAGITMAILRILRSGDTNGAIRLLESRLDSSLIVLGNASREEIQEIQLKTLENVRKYRAIYPAPKGDPVVDAGVARAFELLNHE